MLENVHSFFFLTMLFNIFYIKVSFLAYKMGIMAHTMVIVKCRMLAWFLDKAFLGSNLKHTTNSLPSCVKRAWLGLVVQSIA